MNTILQKRIEEVAKEYSFNIPSKIYLSCKTQEEMKQWKDEIEQAYIEAATFALQNQWISVEKKLPEITKPLLARKGSEIMFAVFEQGLFHLMEGTTIEGITHWMEIPKLGGEE